MLCLKCGSIYLHNPGCPLFRPLMLISLLMCFSVLADGPSYKFRTEWTDNKDNVHFSYGVATAISENQVITTKHLIHKDKNEEMFIKTEDGWIGCDLIREDPDQDFCLLHCRVNVHKFSPLANTLPIGSEAEIHGMNKNSKTLQIWKVTIQNAISVVCEWYDHGSSGSPIIKDDKVVAITKGMETNNGVDPNGKVSIIGCEEIHKMIIFEIGTSGSTILQESPVNQGTLTWGSLMPPPKACKSCQKSNSLPKQSTSTHWEEDAYGQGHQVSD